MNRPTTVIAADDGSVLGVTPPEVVHGLMRDGVTYCWLVEPRPNRYDTDAWVEVIWSVP